MHRVLLPIRPIRHALAAVLLGGLPVAFATGWAVAADFAPLRAEQAPFFSADMAVALDSLGRPAVSVTVTLPYTEMQWIRGERGLLSAVEFTAVFEPRRPGRLYGDVWQRRIAVPGFSASRSPNTSLVERRTFTLPPGAYELRVVVRDLLGEMQSTSRRSVTVPDYSRVQAGFSDLELGVVDSSGAFFPVPTRRFGLDVERLAARAALFDRRPGDWPRRYAFRWRLRDQDGAELAAGTREVEVDRSADPVVVRPDRSDLFLGQYTFEVELIEGRERLRVERSFEVEESGPPRGREFERMLEPLSYIAEGPELEALRSAPAEAQAEAWEAFWRRRDPTPETVRNETMIEFFRRVRYADTHFQGFGSGWRSDMGRIYIRHGAPDQVESRPPSATSVQVEIWYYNQPYRRFVFADREGFGRFVLVSPMGE